MNNYPKLHNAMWPGLVGKGPGSEPFIDLDTMLELTALAESGGNRFDGVDLFLSDPHISIDSTAEQLKKLADKIAAKNLTVGSVVAPVWPPTGGGSAMGSAEERHRFIEQVKKSSRIAQTLRELGIRPYGIIRIDSATDPATWAHDPEGTKKIASTFRQCCSIAEDHGERLAAEGEICWGGMHSWKRMLELLELVDRPQTLHRLEMSGDGGMVDGLVHRDVQGLSGRCRRCSGRSLRDCKDYRWDRSRSGSPVRRD